MILAMVDTVGKNVAEGIVSRVGIGEWLEEERLQPTDIAILVTKVFKPETVVHEVLKDIMGESESLTFPKTHQGLNIRHHVLWKKAVVKWTATTLPFQVLNVL